MRRRSLSRRGLRIVSFEWVTGTIVDLLACFARSISMAIGGVRRFTSLAKNNAERTPLIWMAINLHFSGMPKHLQRADGCNPAGETNQRNNHREHAKLCSHHDHLSLIIEHTSPLYSSEAWQSTCITKVSCVTRPTVLPNCHSAVAVLQDTYRHMYLPFRASSEMRHKERVPGESYASKPRPVADSNLRERISKKFPKLHDPRLKFLFLLSEKENRSCAEETPKR